MAAEDGRGGEAGFTLIELLVVLAIMALAVSLAPALLSPGRAKVALAAGARTLAAELRAARGRAVAQDSETALTLDVDARTIAGNGAAVALPLGVALEFTGPLGLIDGGKGSIRFFPDGSSTGGTVTLSAAGEKRMVAVHWLTGRISLDE